MRAVLVLVAVLFVTACGPIDPAYTGSDAGTLIYGAGIENSTTNLNFRLEYREVRPDGSRSGGVGSISVKRSAMNGELPREFGPSDPELGQVVIQHLKPGRYEVFNYYMSWACGYYKICFDSNDPHDVTEADKNDFSLPFAIEPGKALYLGDFTAYASQNNILAPGAVLYITDKSARDLDIARKRVPKLGEIVVAVPDVGQARMKSLRRGPRTGGNN